MFKYHENNNNCGMFKNGTLKNSLTSETEFNTYNFDQGKWPNRLHTTLSPPSRGCLDVPTFFDKQYGQ